MTTSLVKVGIRSEEPARHQTIFAVVTGVEPVAESAPDGFVFGYSGAEVVLRGLDSAVGEPQAQGLELLVLGVDDLVARAVALRAAGVAFAQDDNAVTVPAREANGVGVELRASRAMAGVGATPAGAGYLDHVAIAVADLQAAVARWEAITGVRPASVGRHPVGEFDVARFELGERMLELASPSPGDGSQMSARLAQNGDGPIALGLVARDLESLVNALEAAGARIVRRPPHVFVHPRDAAGVLVQLTPPVGH